MDLLNIAISQAGSNAKLAKALGVTPAAIGNWKSRGVPISWQIALSLKYKKAIREAKGSNSIADDKVIV